MTVDASLPPRTAAASRIAAVTTETVESAPLVDSPPAIVAPSVSKKPRPPTKPSTPIVAMTSGDDDGADPVHPEDAVVRAHGVGDAGPGAPLVLVGAHRRPRSASRRASAPVSPA